ncbi:ABC-three component system protein [Sphingobium yanoikuyae]|uniref:ABC-three component system protein n=1 Tax=Sphingobium yanoikuyae TaxID=13690 RepID=UPI0008478DE2|nr:ABC-three component system protein [Sphingobium yanoikuyae]
MPQLEFHFANGHTRVEVDATLLSAGQLNLCLLQMPSSHEAVATDASRPSAVAALRDLLAGGAAHAQPALPQLVPGAAPVLIVAPEYAFGSPDWSAINAMVRGAARPIILLAGFGATWAQAVLDWSAATEDGSTKRHLSWNQDANPVSPAMRVNGGWCWIHEPEGDTHCIVYLKNVLQQAVEAVQLPDLQTGEIILHLSCGDIDLFPLICADLIQPAAQHAGSPQARIRDVLAPIAAGRPALVVGSLLQHGFNANWEIAVNALLNTVLVGRPAAVALCNIAHDRPRPDEQEDKWRSLTGVFAPFGELPKGQADLPAARALNAQGIAGAVVRHTHGCATAGMVGWSPYDPVNGVLVWRGNMYCPITADGLAFPIAPAPAAAACEIARFLRRHPPINGMAPRLTEGISMINAQLGDGNSPSPDMVLGATLDGVTADAKRNPDALSEAEVTSALKAGLHALATVRSIDGISWQDTDGMTGQLRLQAQERHLLVWRSPSESPLSMQRHLAAWKLRGGTHPDLVVLGATPLGELSDGEIPEDRRDDISLAPPAGAALAAGGSLAATAGDITETRPLRRVAGLGISHVTSVYADYAEDEDEARVAALMASIGAFFQEGQGQ